MEKQSLKEILTQEEPLINIVIERETSGLVRARKLNKLLDLNPDGSKYMLDILNGNGVERFVIPYTIFTSNKELEKEDEKLFIYDPIRLLFLQSYGLLNDSPLTSYVPSMGIWRLSYYLSTTLPFIDAQVADPNILTTNELEKIIKTEKVDVIGYNLIPVNLKNDLEMITRIHKYTPDVFVCVGGVQSHTLDLVGLVENTPVDIILAGSGIPQLPNLLKMIRNGEIVSKADLRALNNTDRLFNLKNTDVGLMSSSLLGTQIDDRLVNKLIPINVQDNLHPRSYEEMNNRSSVSLPFSIRITNNCEGRCSWCAVPTKEPLLYRNVDEAYQVISSVVEEGNKVLAFNDNDLGDHTEFMIELFELIRELRLELHGKSRIETMTPYLIEAFANAGGVRMAYGVESFDSNVRRKIKPRSAGLKSIEDTLQMTLNSGVIPEINLIWFNPEDNRDSLAYTSKKSLEWLEKGAWIYSTHGLYATLRAPAVTNALKDLDKRDGRHSFLQKIKTEKVFYEGMRKAIVIPSQYRTSEEIDLIRRNVEIRRSELMCDMAEFFGKTMPIHVESMLTPHLVADITRVKSLDKNQVYLMGSTLMKRHYVSI